MNTISYQPVILGDVLESLIDYRGKTPKKRSFGIPLITAKIVKDGFIDEPKEFIAESEYLQWMTRGFPKVGDVILTTEAPLGEVAQVSDTKIALAQRIIVLRGKGNLLNNDYLKYYLISPTGQSKLKERGSGTTVLGIKQSELRQLQIELPDISTQESIASVLSSYDHLIKNNEMRIKILEEMSQRLYTEWFVKFNFPGHKVVKMIDSHIGKIPEGWKVIPLNQAVLVNPTTKLISRENVLHVPMESLSNTLSVIDINKTFRNDKNTGPKFINGDTLFARITPCLQNGKTGYVNMLRNGEIACGSTEFVVFRPHLLTSIYIYLLSRTNDFRETAILTMVGASGRQRVRSEFFQTYQVLVPTEDLLKTFEEMAESNFLEIKKLHSINNNLEQIRDLLIPQLVTGRRKLKV